MRINTRKINKIHKKNKTNKKRYIRKRKSQKKRKTRKQRGGLVWSRRKLPQNQTPSQKYRLGEVVTAPPDHSETTKTKLSHEIPRLFNFLNELKEVGKHQYPGDHCQGVGGSANPIVHEYGNCTGIIVNDKLGNVKKVEMKDMVSKENTQDFLESLGFIEKVKMNDTVSKENKKQFVKSLSLDNFLITNTKWSSSSNITDEKRIYWCKELLLFLTKNDIKKYNIIGAHHNILRGTVIKLSNWRVPWAMFDSSRGISGLKNCSCIRIIIKPINSTKLTVDVELLYEGEVEVKVKPKVKPKVKVKVKVEGDVDDALAFNRSSSGSSSNNKSNSVELKTQVTTDHKWHYVTNGNFDSKNYKKKRTSHKDSIYNIWKAAVDQLDSTLSSNICLALMQQNSIHKKEEMYIDFWRHGDALHNGKVCKIKMLDSPLTMDGINQAIKAGKKMQDKYQHCTKDNTRFCCSPLTRTFDTVIVIMYTALSQRDENDYLKSLLHKIFEKRLNLLNTRYNSTDMNSEIANKCNPKTLKWKYNPVICKINCQNKWWNIGIVDDQMNMNGIDQLIFNDNVNHRTN